MTAFEQDVVALEAPAPALLASVSEPDAIRVLLIDEDPIDRGFLTDVLSTQGFAVRRFNVASLPGAPDAARDADVICTSRGSDVLIRRLKSVVKASRRTDQPQVDRSIICGKLVLRPDVSRAYWNQVDVDLTLGEYNIVHLLESKAGNFVTSRAIYDRMRHEGFIAGEGAEGYRANVRSAIKRIRNKFRDFDPTFDKIENYTGFGYCWRKPS